MRANVIDVDSHRRIRTGKQKLVPLTVVKGGQGVACGTVALMTGYVKKTRMNVTVQLIKFHRI